MLNKQAATPNRNSRPHYQKGFNNPTTYLERAQAIIGAAAISGLLPLLLMYLAAVGLGDI